MNMRVTTTKSKNSELKELSEKLGTDRNGVMAWAREQAHIETKIQVGTVANDCFILFPRRQAAGVRQTKMLHERVSFSFLS